MAEGGPPDADRDLLARLNALKKTHIDLDDKQYRVPVTAHIQPPLDPSPAKALFSDLQSRFKSLNGTKSQDPGEETTDTKSGNDLQAQEDEKTVEELLAELGGEGAWNIEKDEATQIDDLLRSANSALKQTKSGDDDKTADLKPVNTYDHDLPSIDVEISKPTLDAEEYNISEEEGPRKSKKELEADIDREADEMIARLRDELKNAPPEPDSEDEDQPGAKTTSNLPDTPAFDLPTIPSKDPELATETDNDRELAARFASLNLPSTPSTTLPSAPSSKPGTTKKFGSSAHYEGHTNEEIDSWCIICLEDATLRCIGCDGDLYCPKCWIEGHRGPDAGYEERKHKAVEYNKGPKKERRRRIAA